MRLLKDSRPRKWILAAGKRENRENGRKTWQPGQHQSSGDLCALLKAQISVKFSFPLAPHSAGPSKISKLQKKYCFLFLPKQIKRNAKTKCRLSADFPARGRALAGPEKNPKAGKSVKENKLWRQRAKEQVKG